MYKSRIAVIGGVASGPAAAAEAKRVSPESDVVLFERGRHISYGACEMPYFIAGEIEEKDKLVILTPDQFEETRGAGVRTNHSVDAIDVSSNRLTIESVDDGGRWEERFDKIILATGASARTLDVEGGSAENVFVLRRLEDAHKIDRALDLHPVQHAVVVGGGYVGVEVAEALVARGVRVSIVDRQGAVLGRYLDSNLQPIVQRAVESNGVVVRKDTVARMTADGEGRVDSVWTASGERIGCQMVVVCIGTVPNTQLAADAGLRIGSSGGIKVDDGMKTSSPSVWACGDCIEVNRIVDGKGILSPLAPTAYRTARVAARNAARGGRGSRATFDGVTPASGVKVFELEVATVGLGFSEAKAAGFDCVSKSISGWSRVKMYPGSKRIHIDMIAERRTGRLLGAQLVGEEGAVLRANTLVGPIREGWDVSAIKELDFIYSPPFSPSIDPVLVAARQVEKELRR